MNYTEGCTNFSALQGTLSSQKIPNKKLRRPSPVFKQSRKHVTDYYYTYYIATKVIIFTINTSDVHCFVLSDLKSEKQ